MNPALLSPESVLRAFFAVEIPPDIRAGLVAAQAGLWQLGARVGWVAPENIHVTLRFLGDIFGAQIEPLAKLLDEAAAGCEPFEIEVTGLGFFGPPRSPRVVWAGLRDPQRRLAALQQRIESGVRDWGLRVEERPFHSHLTLGRVRPGGHATLGALTRALEQAKDTVHGRCVVDAVCLMQSRLEHAGAHYSLLHKAKLKGTNHG